MDFEEVNFGGLVLALNRGIDNEKGISFRGTLCEVDLVIEERQGAGLVKGALELVSGMFYMRARREVKENTTGYALTGLNFKFRKIVLGALHPPELGTYEKNPRISFVTIAREGNREVRIYESDNMFSS